MPVYHSTFNDAKNPGICNTQIFPLKTKVKGPAGPCKPADKDIIDEALEFYRANVLFRNFESQGPADLTLAYLTVYIGEIMREVTKHKTKIEANKGVQAVSHSTNFAIPGDASFILPGFFKEPKNKQEGDNFRSYYRQLREEAAIRTIDTVYDDKGQSKWWFQFAKRRFMNINKT